MGIVFNADEVLEMAEQVERNGSAFYRKAAKNNANGRKILLQIAEQEDQHLASFRQMRRKLTAKDKESASFDPNNEGGLYLKAMADSRVFDPGKDPAEKLKGNEGLAEILNIAIGLEKDSIIFYLGLKEMVPPKLGEKRISAIIKEEMKHIRWLSERI